MKKDQALADLESIIDAYYGGDSTGVSSAYERLRRNIHQSPPVPEGWTVVPVEPTREMLLAQIAEPLRELVAGHEAEEEVLCYEREKYRAMLAAAPDPRANH